MVDISFHQYSPKFSKVGFFRIKTGGEVVDVDDKVTCSKSSPCYVVAGSNQNDPVKAETQQIPPSQSAYNSDGIDPTSPEITNIAANTDTDINYDQTFQYFPVETVGSDVETTRNPFAVWEADYSN